jgi:hypothetical protein
MIARARVVMMMLPAVAATACGLNQRPQPELAPQSIRLRVTSTTVCAARVCMSAAATVTEGMLARADDDSLLVYDPRRNGYAAFPVAAITRLEIHRGQARGSVGNAASQGVKTAAVGAGVGAAVGFLSGLVIPPIFGGRSDPGRFAAAGAAEGAIQGAAVGAIQGAMMGPALWQAITVRQLREELCHCRLPEPVPAVGASVQPGASGTTSSVSPREPR